LIHSTLFNEKTIFTPAQKVFTVIARHINRKARESMLASANASSHSHQYGW